MRRRTISIDCCTAPWARAFSATGDRVSVMVPSGWLAMSRSGVPVGPSALISGFSAATAASVLLESRRRSRMRFWSGSACSVL